MLKKLDAYIVKTIITSSMIVLFALQSIALLIEVIAAIDDLGEKNYTIVVLILYSLGYSAMKIIHFFPMSLLLGSLLGLGKIAATSELTVMQFSAVSKLRIGILGFSVAATLGIFMLFAHEYIFIPAYEKAVQLRQNALILTTKEKGHYGFWAQSDDSFVNVSGVRSDGLLSGVTIYTVNKKMEPMSIKKAGSAAFKTKGNKQGWQLNNISETLLFSTGLGEIKKNNYPHFFWENQLDEETIGLLLTSPDELKTNELYQYMAYQQSNGIESTVYALAFWQRLFLPLTTGVMFLLALPFVFGPQRNTSQGKKLFVGVIIGLVYFIAYTSIANLILLTGVPVVLGAALPILIFAVISFGLLRLYG